LTCAADRNPNFFVKPHANHINMPAIRHASKRKPPPEGFSDIEDDLLIFSNKMKDAQNTPTDNIPKHQAQWPIFEISHQRSRYIYELYYEKEAISKKLYDWLLKNGYADAMLIAKWKKQGYEKVRPNPQHDKLCPASC
jgi:bud site selection protein 31